MGTRRVWPRFLVGVIAAIVVLCGGPSTSQADDEFILHPGYITGAVSIPGHTIYRINITASAWDPVAQKAYSSTKRIDNQDTYTLVVEAGNWEYQITYYIYLDGGRQSYVRTRRYAAPVPDEIVVIDLTTDAVIEGTVSIAGETVHNANMYAYADAGQGDPQYGTATRVLARRPSGSTDPFLAYSLPVFGGEASFRVQASSVRLVRDNNYDDYIGGFYEVIDAVPVGGSTTYDFHVDPGYVQGTITVNGASITGANVGAEIRDPVTNRTVFSASTHAYADGTYHFPVPPSLAGGHVRLYGDVHTDLGQYGLAIREVELSAGETITNDWTIDLDGTIGGDAVITGVTVDQIYIYGYGPHGAYRNLTLYTPGEYLLDGLVPGEWGIRVHAYDWEHDYQVGYLNYDYYYYPAQSVDLAPGEDKNLDLSFTAGFIEGTLVSETLGLGDYLQFALVHAYAEGYDYPTASQEYAYSQEYDQTLNDGLRGDINHFEMFVAPGTWQLRRFDGRFYLPVKSVTGEDLPYPQVWSYARLGLREYDQDTNQYTLPWLSVGPGETVEFDISADLGLIVPKLSSPNEVFRGPRVDGYFRNDKDGARPYGVSIYAYTNQGGVNEARVTLAALPGWYQLTARAYVQESLVTFGAPFDVYVDAGDIVFPDIGGPEVFILFPPGNYVTHDPCVDVQGSITSDVELTSLTINGTEVTVDENGVFTLQVCDLEIGDNPLTVFASNVSGKSTTVIRTITRINDAPVVVHDGPYFGYEGSSVSFDAGGSTDYENDPLGFQWDFDHDGTYDASGASASHTWYDDYAGTVVVQVSDAYGTSTGEAAVTIYNVVPTITEVVAPTVPVARGALFGITVSYTDAGASDSHTTTFDWGDGSSTTGFATDTAGEGTAIGSYSYTDSGPHEVTITVTDDDGGSASTTVTVVVNTPPEAALAASYEGLEGSSIAFDASGSSDADGDALQYRWDFDGDGTWDTGYSTDATASYLWNDDHTGTVMVEVSDGDLTDADSAAVTVSNMAPTITALAAPVEAMPMAVALTLTASYVDPGLDDTHTATIDWGDGTVETVPVTPGDGGGTVSGAHAYDTGGEFVVTVTVTDDDGASGSDTTIIVVCRIDYVRAVVQAFIDDSSDSDVVDKLEDVVAKLDVALEELQDKNDRQAAAGAVEGAVGDLEAAVEAGLLTAGDGARFMSGLLCALRGLVAKTIGEAQDDPGSDAGKIAEAEAYLAEALSLIDQGKYKDAAAKLKDAVSKAEGARP